MDKINGSYGRHIIKLGSQDTKKIWQMKQENLSQCYSANLNEIIDIVV